MIMTIMTMTIMTILVSDKTHAYKWQGKEPPTKPPRSYDYYDYYEYEYEYDYDYDYDYFDYVYNYDYHDFYDHSDDISWGKDLCRQMTGTRNITIRVQCWFVLVFKQNVSLWHAWPAKIVYSTF